MSVVNNAPLGKQKMGVVHARRSAHSTTPPVPCYRYRTPVPCLYERTRYLTRYRTGIVPKLHVEYSAPLSATEGGGIKD
jgi:hypothetical protein